MRSSTFNTDTVAVYDYTIRKRKTEEMPQIKERIPPLLPSQVSAVFFSPVVLKLEINKWPRALGSKSTLIRLIGRLSDVSAYILEKKPLSVSSVEPPLAGVWRPLVGPVYDCPLTAADFRSLDNKRDFEETLPAGPSCRTGESQMVRYHPEQQWYYFSKMMTDECLVLKCWDSGSGVRAPQSVSLFGSKNTSYVQTITALQAFVDPTTPANAEPRWSIEVRTISLVDVR